MYFDNQPKITTLNKRRYLSFISYFVCICLLFFSSWFKKPVLGIENSIYALIISVIYILYIMYTFIVNFNFFSFKEDDDKFLFRYVSLRPFDNKKKSILIPKTLFKGFRLQKSTLNLKLELILFVQTKNGVVSYPPISISALDNKHVALLKRTLNQYV